MKQASSSMLLHVTAANALPPSQEENLIYFRNTSFRVYKLLSVDKLHGEILSLLLTAQTIKLCATDQKNTVIETCFT